jgi:hypothetical protein
MAEEAVESYRRLVVAYVVGEAIDQGRLREVLILAGKGLDSFKADSDCLRQRYQAAKDIEAADAMQAEITAAGEAIAALENESRDEWERHDKAIKELSARQQEAQGRLTAMQTEQTEKRNRAGEVLQRTADPAIATAVKKCQAQISQAHVDAIARHRVPAPKINDPGRDPLTIVDADPGGRLVKAGELAKAREAEAVAKMNETGNRALDPLLGMAWQP